MHSMVRRSSRVAKTAAAAAAPPNVENPQSKPRKAKAAAEARVAKASHSPTKKRKSTQQPPHSKQPVRKAIKPEPKSGVECDEGGDGTETTLTADTLATAVVHLKKHGGSILLDTIARSGGYLAVSPSFSVTKRRPADASSDCIVPRAPMHPSALLCSGPPSKLLEPPASPSAFAQLAKMIVYQQLAGKAAATIHGRVVAACGTGGVTPGKIASLKAPLLRAAGLSERKVSYVKDLAAHFLDGRLNDALL